MARVRYLLPNDLSFMLPFFDNFEIFVISAMHLGHCAMVNLVYLIDPCMFLRGSHVMNTYLCTYLLAKAIVCVLTYHTYSIEFLEYTPLVWCWNVCWLIFSNWKKFSKSVVSSPLGNKTGGTFFVAWISVTTSTYYISCYCHRRTVHPKGGRPVCMLRSCTRSNISTLGHLTQILLYFGNLEIDWLIQTVRWK